MLQQNLMRLVLASLSAPLRAAALRRASFFRNASTSVARKFTPASAAAAIAAAGAAFYAYSSRAETAQAPAADAAALEAAAASRAGTVVPGLPDYTLQQVSQHKTSGDRIWVTYRNAVYDVTDFVENHPGGMARIMLAGALAGGGMYSDATDLMTEHAILRAGICDTSLQPAAALTRTGTCTPCTARSRCSSTASQHAA